MRCSEHPGCHGGESRRGWAVYNVALNARTSLNQLFGLLRERLVSDFPHLKEYQPVYHDFRSGDVRHSQADISKAKRLLGYEPTHTVEQGLDEALVWFKRGLVHKH